MPTTESCPVLNRVSTDDGLLGLPLASPSPVAASGRRPRAPYGCSLRSLTSISDRRRCWKARLRTARTRARECVGPRWLAGFPAVRKPPGDESVGQAGRSRCPSFLLCVVYSSQELNIIRKLKRNNLYTHITLNFMRSGVDDNISRSNHPSIRSPLGISEEKSKSPLWPPDNKLRKGGPRSERSPRQRLFQSHLETRWLLSLSPPSSTWPSQSPLPLHIVCVCVCVSCLCQEQVRCRSGTVV